jgi:CheY-like chemotaxis protein
MPPHATNAAVNRQLRVLIVDEHEVSRAACTALLRTEGVNVVADVALGCDGVAAAGELSPDVVVVDAVAGALDTGRRLRALPCAPLVVLTSSAECSGLRRSLDGFPFLAKADICARAILRTIGVDSDELRHETGSE